MGTGRPRGRPRKLNIDYKTVEALSSLQCSDDEMASIFGVSGTTFRAELLRSPALAEAIEKGRQSGKINLRRAQWKSAMGGNVVMQIWLGKQYLDQRDAALPPTKDLPPLVIRQRADGTPIALPESPERLLAESDVNTGLLITDGSKSNGENHVGSDIDSDGPDGQSLDQSSESPAGTRETD